MEYYKAGKVIKLTEVSKKEKKERRIVVSKNELFEVNRSGYGLQSMEEKETTWDGKLPRGYICLKSL